VSEYAVVYEQSTTGWGAYCADLPGLGVVGETRDEVQRLISEGIPFHIESLREHGEPVPDPTSTVGTVVVSTS
jgi:predicted RNase H-like HicB family nuclease